MRRKVIAGNWKMNMLPNEAMEYIQAFSELVKDSENKLSDEQIIFILQVIAEWSFHKSIDLVHSRILPEYWDGIMQKIAFTIF